jgi:hypothetical protein
VALIRITLNGKSLIDRDAGEWTQNFPELEQYLTPDAKPAPWMQCTLIALTMAVVQGKPFTADVTTLSDGWDLSVRTPQ